jgi:hypothetical protein
MRETDTIFALNEVDPIVDFDYQSYVLIKPFHPKLKAYPYQSFQVIVMTDFVLQSDIAMLFDEEDGIVVVSKETTAAELMCTLGIFLSKGQARKNGWPGPIPDGWSELRPGKHVVFIWKPTE